MQRGSAPLEQSPSGQIIFDSAAGPRVLDNHQDVPLDPLLQPDILKPSGGTNGAGLVDQEVKEAAIALAQLSVARQGDFLGTGSVVCALHKACLHSTITHLFTYNELDRWVCHDKDSH